jgi:hypothetical protein
MRPTPNKEYGICGNCREYNLYSAINCTHCGARLVWAFMIDGKRDFETEPLIEQEVEHFLHLDREPKRPVLCRFCNQSIEWDEKICPHCRHWLIITRGSGSIPALGLFQMLDPLSPDILALVQRYIDWKNQTQ